jgi:hypothetical protein
LVGVAQGPSGTACITHGNRDHTRGLSEISCFQETFQMREMLLRRDKVPTKIMRSLFSMVREGEARGAAVASGQVQNPVREPTGCEVIARYKDALKDPKNPTNELGQVAAFLSENAGALSGFARLRRGKPFRDEEPLSESAHLYLARVTFIRFRQCSDPLQTLLQLPLGLRKGGPLQRLFSQPTSDTAPPCRDCWRGRNGWEFGQMVIERACVERFERCADTFVQLLAPFDQYRVVCDLLRECVLENIFGIADRGLLVDEFAQLQVIEQGAEFVVSFRRDRSNQ